MAAADGNNPKHVLSDGVDGNAPRSNLPNNKKAMLMGKRKPNSLTAPSSSAGAQWQMKKGPPAAYYDAPTPNNHTAAVKWNTKMGIYIGHFTQEKPSGAQFLALQVVQLSLIELTEGRASSPLKANKIHLIE